MVLEQVTTYMGKKMRVKGNGEGGKRKSKEEENPATNNTFYLMQSHLKMDHRSNVD